MEKVIQRGAEAVLIKKGNGVVKRRVVKGYRIKELDDKLRKLRTRSEAKLLESAGKLIDAPRVGKSSDRTMEIDMEFIEGLKLSDNLDELKNWREICLEIGRNIAKLHDKGIIHGDLTTSNMIYNRKENKIYFIDFGLGFFSNSIEDKAVDIHLIKEALEAKHFMGWEKFFKAVLEGYRTSRSYKETMKRLEKVEKRGRYKEQY